MSIKLEIFTSPTCSSCKQAKRLVQKIIDDIGPDTFEYREVDITEDMEYATKLGIRNTSSIAINGDLPFTSVPKEQGLRTALQDRG